MGGGVSRGQPVIDVDVIPAHLLHGISTGAAANIDLMVGTASDERWLFMVPNGEVGQITQAMLPGAIAARGIPVDAVLATFRATRPGASAGDLLTAIMGDWYFRIPAMRLADAHAASAATLFMYVYAFAWRSPQFIGTLGAYHGIENPFVFDTLGHGTELLLGKTPMQ